MNAFSRKNQLIFSIILTAAVLTPFASRAAKLFTDVPLSHPYFEAVAELEKRGILNGYADGSFQPDVPISRSGALKVTLLSGGVEISGKAMVKPFPDVALDAWYAPVVKKGVEMKIVKGDGQGNFVPERTVSRAEALAMLFRIEGTNPPVPSASPFTDVPLSAWYANYFQAAKSEGLITGASANPEHKLSRAELADLAYRFFKDSWQTVDSEMVGQASYYGSGADGSNTASGETFTNTEFLAAHRTLPFGTRVRVTNTDNLQSVVVKIVDRGPHVEGRVIDLSQAAFAKLAPLSQGVAPVTLETVSPSQPLGYASQCEPVAAASRIAADFYPGIQLDKPLPSRFRVNETAIIRGQLVGGTPAEEVTAFYGEGEKKTRAHAKVNGNRFELALFFGKAGSFNLGMFPGLSGKTPVEKITVSEPSCEPVFTAAAGIAPQNFRAAVKNGKAVFTWNGSDNDLFRIEITQAGKRAVYFVRDTNTFFPPLLPLREFSEGKMEARIWGAKSNGDAFTRTGNWAAGNVLNVFATEHVSRENNKLTDVHLTEEFTAGQMITISGTTDRKLRDQIVIAEPGDTFVEVPLNQNGNSFSASFKTAKAGTHLVEVLQSDALALFVGASVPAGTLPLLPDFFDVEAAGGNEVVTVANVKQAETMLALVNAEREQRGFPRLTLDSALDRLADFRANDMCTKNYFGHTDPSGKSVEDYRAAFGVKTGVGENIAKHDDIAGAHAGLMRSPIHRRLILDAENTRVGFGFCISQGEDDDLVAVQLFGGEPFTAGEVPRYREAILADVNSARASKPILPNTTLQSVAQKWAELMAEHEFWGFEYESESLEKMLRSAGINNHTRSFVFKVGSVSELDGAFGTTPIAIGSNSQQNFLLDTAYGKMGVGIAQSVNWDIYLVIIAIK